MKLKEKNLSEFIEEATSSIKKIEESSFMSIKERNELVSSTTTKIDEASIGALVTTMYTTGRYNIKYEEVLKKLMILKKIELV